MTAFLWGVGCGVVGLLAGMWMAKHPDDTRTYAEAAIARVKSLFAKKGTSNG